MPILVSRDVIDRRVVKEWSKLMELTAQDKEDNINIVQPFHPFEQTYSEVMEEVRNNTREGLRFYRYMVRQLPWYTFDEKK